MMQSVRVLVTCYGRVEVPLCITGERGLEMGLSIVLEYVQYISF